MRVRPHSQAQGYSASLLFLQVTMVSGRPTYLWAAERILRKQGQPLRVREIVNYAHEEGLFTDEMHSRTPQKSMQARLSLDILKKGEQSTFSRSARGLFCLRENLISATGMIRPLSVGEKSRELERATYVAPRRAPPPETEGVLAIPKSHYERICRSKACAAITVGLSVS